MCVCVCVCVCVCTCEVQETHMKGGERKIDEWQKYTLQKIKRNGENEQESKWAEKVDNKKQKKEREKNRGNSAGER